MNNFNRKGSSEPQESLSEFKSMFSLLGKPKQGFRVHPDQATLKAYLRGDLPEEWRAPNAAEATPWIDQSQSNLDWSLQDVSLHVATCHRCSKAIASLRQDKTMNRFEEYFLAFNITGLRGRLWSYANAVALVAAFAVITQISWNSNPIVDVVDRATPVIKSVETSPLNLQANDRLGNMLISTGRPIGASAAGGGGGGNATGQMDQNRGYVGFSL